MARLKSSLKYISWNYFPAISKQYKYEGTKMQDESCKRFYLPINEYREIVEYRWNK